MGAVLVLSLTACLSSSTKHTSAEVMLDERMANVLLHEERWADAERVFRDVVKADPRNPSVHDGLGVSLLSQGRVKEAVEWFDKAVKYAPEGALYRIHRGMARTQSGDYPGAEEDFKWAASSTSPDDQLDLAIQRGRLKQRRGDFAGAEALFEEALSRDPRNFTAVLGRGVSREAQGKMEPAAQDYLDAVKLQPKNAEANLRLGLALVSLHREVLGRRYLERTADLDPGGEAGSKARLILESLGPETRRQ